MRILRLELKAFGHFTDLGLDLSAGREGLHIIYGANEAGKSTALRGLEQLFFGMPERSGDEFLHPSPRLRIGATLRHSDGGTVQFWRRRARKNPLNGGDDRTPLDPHELVRFLGKLDQNLFASMFGLNRATLEKGGREILQGGGQIGQILFAAGSGIADLRTVQKGLQAELDELFKPTGKNQKINRAFQELGKARECIKENQLPSEDWLAHDQALAQAEARRSELQKEQERLAAEERRLNRLRDAKPVLARRQEVLAALEPVRDALLLPNDFSERRRQILTDLAHLDSAIKQARERLEGLAEQMVSLVVPEDLLAQGDAIEDLFRRLGEFQKAVAELPQRLQQITRLRQEAQDLWHKLGKTGDPGQAEQLRLRPEELVQFRKLAREHPGLQADRKNAQTACERLARLEQQLRQTLDSLPPPRDVTDLHRAVRQVQQQGPLEEEWTTLCHKVEQAREQAQRLLAQLPGWTGTLAELKKVAIPAAETIDRFQGDFQASLAHGRELGKKVQASATDLQHLDGQLQELEAAQPLPSENDLAQARHRRDRGWQLVRQTWLDKREDVSARDAFLREMETTDLAEAFERSIRQADFLADRLRGEADRIARKAELLTQQEQRSRELEQLRRELAQVQAQDRLLQANWQQLVQPLGTALPSPREIRSWLGQYQAIVQQAAQAEELQGKVEGLQIRIRQLAQYLEQCLEKIQGPLDPLLRSLSFLMDLAQRHLDEQGQLCRRRQELERDLVQKNQELRQAQRDRDQAEQAWGRWQTNWTGVMQRLGLEAETDVEAASNFCESLQELTLKLQESVTIQNRREALERDLAGFTKDVQAVQLVLGKEPMPAAEINLPGTEHPFVKVVGNLYQDLKKVREIKQKRTAVEDAQAAIQKQLHKDQHSKEKRDGDLGELCRQAHCSRPEELPAVEEHSRGRQELEKELNKIDQQLTALRGDLPLEEFSAQVAQLNIECLEIDLAKVEEENKGLGKRLQEVDQTIGMERKILADMDGSAAAVEAADQAELLLAQIQTDARNYLVRRLAMGVLQESIDRYRQKSEGRVVQRAGDLFALLTNGAFEGLHLDTNDHGETVLSGLRSGDPRTVSLEGMSDGTRDQLFLALRLASLEIYLEAHEPIPFIVDDLLVNFDDKRARAALEALAQLSRRTQVFFFTHHRHLVELARQSLPAEVVFFHELPERQSVIEN